MDKIYLDDLMKEAEREVYRENLEKMYEYGKTMKDEPVDFYSLTVCEQSLQKAKDYHKEIYKVFAEKVFQRIKSKYSQKQYSSNPFQD